MKKNKILTKLDFIIQQVVAFEGDTTSIAIFQFFDTTFIVRFLFLVKISLRFSDYFIIGLKFLSGG